MPTLVKKQKEFEAIVSEAARSPRYCIDTEFHRERTYYPQLALVQLAWQDQIALIDPLSVDIKALVPLLNADALCIMHAGVQDLEIINLECKTLPKKFLDTQIAAGFLGIATGSLSSLLDKFLNVSLPKANRLTDWLQRPLTDKQLAYAAGDVQYLFSLSDELQRRLETRNRWNWAVEESELLRAKPHTPRRPKDAIMRIKEARMLKGDARKVAAALAAWRERRAAEINCPVRQVLPDLGIVTIAQRAPKKAQDFKGLRGADTRHFKGEAGEQILAAVKEGLAAEPTINERQRSPELPRHLRPAIALITAWIAQLAREHKLDPALLATRADIEAFLKGDETNRLNFGWRSEMAGAPINHLVNGSGAIAFEEGKGLILESRSHTTL